VDSNKLQVCAEECLSKGNTFQLCYSQLLWSTMCEILRAAGGLACSGWSVSDVRQTASVLMLNQLSTCEFCCEVMRRQLYFNVE
jgi:hypothetical protein